MMFSKENRTLWDDTKLGFIFGFFGGYFNAAAILILLYEIGPMSANWGGMAKEIGRADYVKVFTYAPLILCFVTGAYIGARWVKKYSPLSLVITESILLMGMAFLSLESTVLTIALGGFAMGLQNGMTTQISHHAVRTSHLTSTVTDTGIALARGNYKSALVKGSKTIVFMWGACVGVLKVNLLGNMAFAMGGLYLFSIMVALYGLLPKCAACLRRDMRLEEWFTSPAKASAVPVSSDH